MYASELTLVNPSPYISHTALDPTLGDKYHIKFSQPLPLCNQLFLLHSPVAIFVSHTLFSLAYAQSVTYGSATYPVHSVVLVTVSLQ